MLCKDRKRVWIVLGKINTFLRLSFVVLCGFYTVHPAFGEDAVGDGRQCAPCPECPSCEDEVDLSDWQLTTALGFNLTRGNSDTLLLTNKTTAAREINRHIYHASIDGSYGQDKDVDDEETGSTTQKQVRLESSYKHLFSTRVFSLIGASAFFDEIADVDYRYVLSPGVGYFLLKDDTFRLSIETGPSYVFEKKGGDKNDYLSPRFAEHFEWNISATSRVFQTVEVLLSVEDSDDTLVIAEAGIEAAINAHFSLVLSIKDVYDNLPAEDAERNDLTVVAAIQAKLR